MLEIEMKFPVTDFSPIREQLKKWQACHKESREEADHYFNAPDRDFAQTDEACRLRCIGDRNIITYKGPKTDPHTKTRTEIEVALADGSENAKKFQQLVQHLGYRFVSVVRKHREIFTLQRNGFALEICLDRVDDLGRFVELEIVGSENELTSAQNVLKQVAAELGLQTSERRSYLELLLEQRTPEARS